MDKQLLDYIKLLSLRDKKTLSQKALKVAEEAGELARVVLPYDSAFATNHRFVARESILEECADIMLTALSVAYDQKFDHEEIAAMITAKSAKWAKLQTQEEGLKYPIPFEIHVTVKEINAISTFKEDCTKLNVKPIVLDLYHDGGVILDVMTSSKHFGTNASAYEESQRIERGLRDMGYNVSRVKIESVPWHPKAPNRYDQVMPIDCYFEAHIPVILEPRPEFLNHLTSSIKDIDDKLGVKLHKSANTFKKHDDGKVTIMLTYRMTKGFRFKFEENVAATIEALKNYGFDVGKTHSEFSVYDTKVSHDAEWLKVS